MNKYKNYIIEGLNNKIGILENNQKPKAKTKKLKEIIRTHNSSHINNIDIVHIYETDYIDEVEKCINNKTI